MEVRRMMQRLVSRVENLFPTVYISLPMFAGKILCKYQNFVNKLIQVTNIIIAEEPKSPWLIQKNKINTRQGSLVWGHLVSRFISHGKHELLTEHSAQLKAIMSTQKGHKLTTNVNEGGDDSMAEKL